MTTNNFESFEPGFDEVKLAAEYVEGIRRDGDWRVVDEQLAEPSKYFKALRLLGIDPADFASDIRAKED